MLGIHQLASCLPVMLARSQEVLCSKEPSVPAMRGAWFLCICEQVWNRKSSSMHAAIEDALGYEVRESQLLHSAASALRKVLLVALGRPWALLLLA
jgi:hypothetical protein